MLVVVFVIANAQTFAGTVGDPSVPYLAAPKTDVAPNLDGEIGASEWEAASGPSALIDIAKHSIAGQQPEVWVTWDDEALFVAARLPLPKGKAPVAKVTARDGNVWEDDAIEVFLDPTHSHGDYYQFIVNSAGAQWDSHKKDGSWNADWQANALVAEGHWSVEMRIPFAALGRGTPEADELWGFNFAWDRQTPSPLIASWGHVESGLHDPSNFGHISFVAGAPAVQVAGPVVSPTGGVGFSGTWRAAMPIEARLSVTRQDAEAAEEVASATAVYAGGEAPAPLSIDAELPKEGGFPKPGDYRVSLAVTEKGRTVYLATAPLAVPRPLEVTLRKYFLEGKIELDVDASGLGRPARQTTVAAQMLDATGKRLQTIRLPRLSDAWKTTGALDVSKLGPGEYQVMVAGSGKHRVLYRTSMTFTKPETPAWLGSKEGFSEEVLAPWTPLELEGNVVRMWGREYAFGPLPFPARVLTADESILAGPITLRMTADGKEQSWRQIGEVRNLLSRPNRMQLGTTAAGENVRCEGQIAIEYDGMVRSDFTVTPRGVKEIEHLSLVIPIKEEHAKYLYHFPGRWQSAYNAGALPEEGFTAAFRPFVWLGDDDRGFAWFSESDRNFFVEDANEVIKIAREDGVVTLQVNIITGKHPVSGPLKYTFGFQATPVKPLKPDVWDYRICHHGAYGLEDQPWHSPATLTYPAEGNINLAQGTFEAWVRPRFNPQPDIEPDDPGRGRLNRNLLDVDFNSGDHIGFYWNIDDRGMRLYYKQGDKYPLMICTHPKWQAGEWRHVAFTWGDKTCVYVDGKMLAERDYKGTLARSLTGAKIVLGNSPCEFDIDEVRISDIPREGFDLTRPPAADEHTLLLDRLDTSLADVAERKTSPEKGSPAAVRGGRAIAGKFGKALGRQPDAGEMTMLDRLAELGVKTICFHEHWTDIQNYTSTTHGEKLHKLVKACHEHGIRLLLYFGYEISNIAPEWDLYSDECLVYPRAGGYHRQPEQRAYIVCYNGAWQDFMAHGIAKMMDEYDIDGVYLDGTEYPHGCRNVHHGCGYKRPDGTIGTTYSLFATREMMRRIYTIVKTRKPDGEVNVHNSTCMTIPTLAWATSSWDGEQFGSIDRGPDPLEVLPLDAFRCEFMGRQWGVPAEMLCYGRPYTYSEAMSFTLLHDVLVRGALGGNLEMEAGLWKGMEEFGRDGAVWLPYWDNEDYIDLGPDQSIKASIYSRAEQGAVVVVSNLGSEEKIAQVKLDYEGLALSAGMEARDMITGEAVELSEHFEMSFPLKPFGFRVIWVRAG